MTEAVVITGDADLLALRRILEVGTFIFDVDDDAHHLALELLETLDREANR